MSRRRNPLLVWAVWALLALAVCCAVAQLEPGVMRMTLALLSGVGVGGLISSFWRSVPTRPRYQTGASRR